MRRRQSFTVVELLVAMALIMFMMAILSQAFVSSTGVFRNLKAAGDMAEKLRAVTQLLQRDLAADHFEGKKRLSDPNFWIYGPPQQGFFQIYQGSSPSSTPTDPCYIEGKDLDGIGSYRTVDHSLAFTIKLRGNQMSDFLSAGAQGGGTLLNGITTFGPSEARYQLTSGSNSYNYQWAEVAWFLSPSTNPATGQQETTDGNIPLYTLYRRQRLLVPDNNQVPSQPATSASQFLEVSNWQPQGPTGPLYFNSPINITDPQRRFGGGVGAYQTLTSQGATGGLAGADIQLTDVVSFDVRILFPPSIVPLQGVVDPFVTLWQAPYITAVAQGGMNYYNPQFYDPINNPKAPMVFDTWTSINDGLSRNYTQWNNPNLLTSIPVWRSSGLHILNGSPPGLTVAFSQSPIIQALQISIRIWDAKTNQTRQVTIVQAM